MPGDHDERQRTEIQCDSRLMAGVDDPLSFADDLDADDFRDAVEILLHCFNGDERQTLMFSLILQFKGNADVFDVVNHAEDVLETAIRYKNLDSRLRALQRNVGHNYAGALVLSVFEVINNGNRGEISVDRFRKTIKVVQAVRRISEVFPSRPASAIYEFVKSRYVEQYGHLVNPFEGEDFRHNLYRAGDTVPRNAVCSNLLYAEEFLTPRCNLCPFCDRKMQNQDSTFPVLLIHRTGRTLHWLLSCLFDLIGFAYGRSIMYTCGNKQQINSCVRPDTSRGYDYIMWKDAGRLVRQWDRYGYYATCDFDEDGPGGVTRLFVFTIIVI